MNGEDTGSRRHFLLGCFALLETDELEGLLGDHDELGQIIREEAIGRLVGAVVFAEVLLDVKGGGKVRRVAGRSKTAALPEEFCENAWSLTALEAVAIMRVSAERKGSVLQHGTVGGHSEKSTPRGRQQASDSAGDGDALDDAGEDSGAPAPPRGYQRRERPKKPKIDPYVARIREVLEQDEHIHKKQRHTAKRIWERLQEEGFAGGYTMVKEAVREIRRIGKEVFLPLQHPPGEAQVDLGHALVKMGGVLRKVCFFVMTLPYSDAFFVRA